MNEHRQFQRSPGLLPQTSYLPVNHCNLPASVLGSLSYQRHPVPLHLDGVEPLHAALFESLNTIAEPVSRAENFRAYMRSCFLLDHLDEAGLDTARRSGHRGKADYLRILRGWLFDPDGREAAVLKGWVESRFGLLPRNHRGPVGDNRGDNYRVYLADRAAGLYNSNALESQLDLLFSYCQYEVQRQYPAETHFHLYRGISRLDDHEILHQPDKHRYILMLNNINSFTGNRERADEFGDYILEARAPLAKLLYVPGLLPDTLQGEEEYLVIGGVYDIKLYTP